ncbi:MAG: DUF5683 domain-containing protein [Flavobacteriaceae bacterium]
MKSKLYILVVILFSQNILWSQEDTEEKGTPNKEEVLSILQPDSLQFNKKYSPRIQRLIADPLTPAKAGFYSTILPGLGQVFLGKGWKVPIIYAALGTSFYYYDLQNKEMKSYRKAYKRRLNGFFDDEYLEKDIPITTEQLLIGMEFHKNYRDIALMALAASYILNILEANVSAHLLQFNVNDDLSLQPNFIFDPEQMGLKLAITLK